MDDDSPLPRPSSSFLANYAEEADSPVRPRLLFGGSPEHHTGAGGPPGPGDPCWGEDSGEDSGKEDGESDYDDDGLADEEDVGEEEMDGDGHWSHPPTPAAKPRAPSQAGRKQIYQWSTSIYFPNGACELAIGRASRIQSMKYICFSKSCPQGGCVHAAAKGETEFADADILYARKQFTQDMNDSGVKRLCYVKNVFKKAYSNPSGVPGMGQFDRITVSIEEGRTVKLCIRSYALVVAAISFWSFVQCRAAVANNKLDVVDDCDHMKPQTVHEQFQQLRAYVRDFADKHAQHDPVPGVQSGNSFSSHKMSWRKRWNICVKHFNDNHLVAPGSETLLRKAWKSVNGMRDRTDIRQDKCRICLGIQVKKAAIKCDPTRAAVEKRASLDSAQEVHDKFISGERDSYDDAAYLAMFSPWQMWTICVDAATQSNFKLPRLPGRKPKGLDSKNTWCTKLFAAYAHGFGLHIHLVPDYVDKGSNLTVTVMHLMVMAMVKSGRPTPDCIHFQLDNTTGDNKNNTVFAYAVWLVQCGFCKRVRIFFLRVGHTHIFIDHIFGTVTKGIRVALLSESALIESIRASCESKPTYMLQHCDTLHFVWNFTQWWESALDDGKLSNAFGGYTSQSWLSHGYYDFVAREPANVARGPAELIFRKSSQASDWKPDGEPVRIFVDGLPQGSPAVKAPIAMGDIQATAACIAGYITSCFAGSVAESRLYVNQWGDRLANVPTTVADLKDHVVEFEVPIPNVQSRTTGRANDVIPGRANNVISELEELYDEVENPEFDQVHHKARPKSQIAKEMREYLDSIRGNGPISSSANEVTPVFPGDFVLARPPAVQHDCRSTVALYRVNSFLSQKSYRSPDLELNCTLYHHTPQPNVAGLFGTFAVANRDRTTTGAQSRAQRYDTKTIRHNITRDLILVFNCGRRPDHSLDLDTLECLSKVCPDSFALPNTLPASHAPERSSGKRKAAPGPSQGRRAQRVGRASSSAAISDSSDDEDVRCEDEDEDEDEDDDDDDDDEAILGESEEADGELQGRTVYSGHDVLLDMTGDEEFANQECPVGLVNVVDVNRSSGETTFTARWYERHWKAFKTPDHMRFDQFRADEGLGSWTAAVDPVTNLPIQFAAESVIPVALKWNVPEARGRRVVLSKASTSQVVQYCRDHKLLNVEPATM